MARRTAVIAVSTAALLSLAPAAVLAQVPGSSTTVPPPPPPAVAQPAPSPPAPQIGQPAAPPTAAPSGGDKARPIADSASMAADIRVRMKDAAFGWQFAIAQQGRLVTDANAAGGTARTAADNAGATLPMKATMRYELASLTKNVTAVATMKLLRMKGKTVESLVAPYLPPSWQLSGAFKQMRFRHLLAHTSGINQMLINLQLTRPVYYNEHRGNDWADMRWLVGRDVKLDSTRSYKNLNYGLLGVLNARMWRELGHTLETTVQKGDKQVPSVLQPDSQNHALYQMDFNQQEIFTPAGIANVGCVAPKPKQAGLNYGSSADESSFGKLLSWPAPICAGNAGLRLSAIETVRYLAHLRHGTIIDPRDLKKMDELRLGWNEDSNGGDGDQNNGPADGKPDNWRSPGVFWHAGDLITKDGKGPEVHTCGMTFVDGTEASMIVNSPMKTDKPCGVLLKAWMAAR